MYLLRWILTLPFDIGFTLLAYLLAPILPLFATSDDHLPSWLSWFDTPDNPLSGDAGWNDPAQHPLVAKLPAYLRKICWLWRNPAYGWSCNVTSIAVAPGTTPTVYGTPNVGNIPYVPGVRLVVAGGPWEFYLVAPSLFGRCLRVRIGWKVGNLVTAKDPGPYQFVFAPNPLMGRSE